MWIKVTKTYVGPEGEFYKNELRDVSEKLLKQLGKKLKYQEILPPHERGVDFEARQRQEKIDQATDEHNALQQASIRANDTARTTDLAAQEMANSVATNQVEKVEWDITSLQEKLDKSNAGDKAKKKMALQIRELIRTRWQYEKFLAEFEVAKIAGMAKTDAKIAADKAAKKLSDLKPPTVEETNNETDEPKPDDAKDEGQADDTGEKPTAKDDDDPKKQDDNPGK